MKETLLELFEFTIKGKLLDLLICPFHFVNVALQFLGGYRLQTVGTFCDIFDAVSVVQLKALLGHRLRTSQVFVRLMLTYQLSQIWFGSSLPLVTNVPSPLAFCMRLFGLESRSCLS